MQTPPDTSAYMIAGYIVFFSVTIVYIISLISRWKKLERDLKTLEEIDE